MTIAENWPTPDNLSVLMVGGQTYTHRSQCGKIAREVGRINSQWPRLFAFRLHDLNAPDHTEGILTLTEDLSYIKGDEATLVKGASEQFTATKLADVDLGYTPNDTVVFKDGRKYTHRTRDGRFARIIETGRKHESFNVIALVATPGGPEILGSYTDPDFPICINLRFAYGPYSSENTMDLIKGACPSIDWHRVAKGTPVRFYSSKGEIKGVFNGPDELGSLVCELDDRVGFCRLSNLANLTIY